MESFSTINKTKGKISTTIINEFSKKHKPIVISVKVNKLRAHYFDERHNINDCTETILRDCNNKRKNRERRKVTNEKGPFLFHTFHHYQVPV